MEKDTIRVSCAGIARIIFDNDKYLLIQNKKQRSHGILKYGPIGGALEYNEDALEFLMSIDVEFEKGSDLRLHIPIVHLDTFIEWFKSKKDRETTVFREMFEEMVEEECYIDSLTPADVTEEYSKLVQTTVDWDVNGVIKTTLHLFEVFNVEIINTQIKQTILDKLQTNDSLKLFTQEEINTLEVVSGHSKFIL